jgi:hypothetical protein
MFYLGFRPGNVGGHPSAPRALAVFCAPCSVSFGSMSVLQTPFCILVRSMYVPVCYVAPFLGENLKGEKAWKGVPYDETAIFVVWLSFLFQRKFGGMAKARGQLSKNTEVWRKRSMLCRFVQFNAPTGAYTSSTDVGVNRQI